MLTRQRTVLSVDRASRGAYVLREGRGRDGTDGLDHEQFTGLVDCCCSRERFRVVLTKVGQESFEMARSVGCADGNCRLDSSARSGIGRDR